MELFVKLIWCRADKIREVGCEKGAKAAAGISATQGSKKEQNEGEKMKWRFKVMRGSARLCKLLSFIRVSLRSVVPNCLQDYYVM